jgi:quinol monooxygenase YgiN
MSQKIYALEQYQSRPGEAAALFERLKALEPDALRETGCLSYVTTRHLPSPFAPGESFNIVVHSLWEDRSAFEVHCARAAVVAFHETECNAPDGIVAAFKTAIYTDDPGAYDLEP